MEVKNYDGGFVEAELQVDTWCAEYLTWMHLLGKEGVPCPCPPLVACTMVGIHVDFFVAYAEEDSEGSFKVVCTILDLDMSVIALSLPLVQTICGPQLELWATLDTEEGVGSSALSAT